ncbi:MAG: Holliday junction branch migration DNA helicase RuvB, partial [Sphingomonadales bacterium]|nr:Holliday junction branch migration DNA helicase RuvB [Sphingomonadales bacterium]
MRNPHLDAEGLESVQPEQEQEIQLRPKTFGDFAGQDKVMDNLKVFV